MMNRSIRYILVATIITILLVGLSACTLEEVPPGCAEIEEQFESSYDDITLVTNYLLSLPYEVVYIEDDRKGEYWADFEWHNISDETIETAVKRLRKQGIYHIEKDFDNNSIVFRMWRSYRDIDSGILYTIDPSKETTTQYLTTLEPLETERWHYYVADFNQWRKSH